MSVYVQAVSQAEKVPVCHVLEPTFQLTANESWSVLTSKEGALTSAGGEKQGWTPRGQCGTVGIVSGIPKDVRFPRWALTQL